jgi:hypothetical protein
LTADRGIFSKLQCAGNCACCRIASTDIRRFFNNRRWAGRCIFVRLGIEHGADVANLYQSQDLLVVFAYTLTFRSEPSGSAGRVGSPFRFEDSYSLCRLSEICTALSLPLLDSREAPPDGVSPIFPMRLRGALSAIDRDSQPSSASSCAAPPSAALGCTLLGRSSFRRVQVAARLNLDVHPAHSATC